MSQPTHHDRMDAWRAQLETLDNQLAELYCSRQIYRKLNEIIDSNPVINHGNHLYQWIFGNYAMSAAITIRRLMDPSNYRGTKPVSLYHLVQDMRDHADVITRAGYVALYHASERRRADENFTYWAGDGDALDPDRANQILKQSRVLCNLVKQYVDQYLAHNDPNAINCGLKYGEVNGAIDEVGELFRWAHALLTGNSRMLEPVACLDWLQVMRVPWIPPVGDQRGS